MIEISHDGEWVACAHGVEGRGDTETRATANLIGQLWMLLESSELSKRHAIRADMEAWLSDNDRRFSIDPERETWREAHDAWRETFIADLERLCARLRPVTP